MEGDVHPPTAMLHVGSWVSGVILICRNLDVMVKDHYISGATFSFSLGCELNLCEVLSFSHSGMFYVHTYHYTIIPIYHLFLLSLGPPNSFAWL